MNDPLAAIWGRADAREPRFSGDEVAAWDEGLAEQLLAAVLIRQVENATSVLCDACAEGHTEEVTSVRSSPRSPVRTYISCPENGRVNVPLTRLRQWGVDFGGFAEAINDALELAGVTEEVVPGRIWCLGKATVAALSRELFLARGLTWEDARNVLGACTRLNAARSAIVLVAGEVPLDNVWNGDVPPVVALKTITGWNGGGISIDRVHLESLLSAGRRKTAAVPLVSFPTPAGTMWGEVRLVITDSDLRIEAKGKRKDYTFQEAGLDEKRRKNKPDRLWALLKLFGVHGGILPFKDAKAQARTNVKQYVSDLRKRLTALLPSIEGESIAYDKDETAYKTAFRISSQDALQFPTPAGAMWTDVSIARNGEAGIQISVEATERFPAHEFVSERDGSTSKHSTWGETVGAVERSYDLRTLNLADEQDRPNRAGQALLDVLSGKGTVNCREKDKGMAELCGVLTKLMGIDGSPFDYAKIEEKWIALFDATEKGGAP